MIGWASRFILDWLFSSVIEYEIHVVVMMITILSNVREKYLISHIHHMCITLVY
jgi:hypothetical protein